MTDNRARAVLRCQCLLRPHHHHQSTAQHIFSLQTLLGNYQTRFRLFLEWSSWKNNFQALLGGEGTFLNYTHHEARKFKGRGTHALVTYNSLIAIKPYRREQEKNEQFNGIICTAYMQSERNPAAVRKKKNQIFHHSLRLRAVGDSSSMFRMKLLDLCEV